VRPDLDDACLCVAAGGIRQPRRGHERTPLAAENTGAQPSRTARA
jgi:hypothetical protein